MAACLIMVAWMLMSAVAGCNTGGSGQNGGNGNGNGDGNGNGNGQTPPVDPPGDGDPDTPPVDQPPPDDEPPIDEPPPDDEPPVDEPPVDTGLPAEAPRQAFQSQCAQNVLNCTTSWPDAVLGILPGAGQQIFDTPDGFIIVGSDSNGFEDVQLIGDLSETGQGSNVLLYSWSSGAIDSNPCTMAPGPEFSTNPNPVVRLAAGVHYIRLTVTNDIIRNELSQECGVLLSNEPSFDFEEVEIIVED